MALLGPMVVVAESPAADIVDALAQAGAFPIVETSIAEAPAAIAEIQPAAVILADPEAAPEPRATMALVRAVERRGGPYMPVLARIESGATVVVPLALPVDV